MKHAANLGLPGFEEVETLDAGHTPVHRVISTGTGDTVALKFLDRAGEPLLPRRFDRRLRTLSRLCADGIGFVPLLDHGIATDGRAYVVMPHYPLGSLQDQLDHGPTPWYLAGELMAKVAEILGRAHDHEVALGGIRPAGILLAAAGEPVVAVFGMATRRFDDGGPSFAAPGADRGRRATPADDVFSLAAIFGALLLGRARARHEPVSNFIEELRPLAPSRITEIIEHGLAERPINRYGDAGLMRRALVSALGADPDLDTWTEPEVTAEQPLFADQVTSTLDILPSPTDEPSDEPEGDALPGLEDIVFATDQVHLELPPGLEDLVFEEHLPGSRLATNEDGTAPPLDDLFAPPSADATNGHRPDDDPTTIDLDLGAHPSTADSPGFAAEADEDPTTIDLDLTASNGNGHEGPADHHLTATNGHYSNGSGLHPAAHESDSDPTTNGHYNGNGNGAGTPANGSEALADHGPTTNGHHGDNGDERPADNDPATTNGNGAGAPADHDPTTNGNGAGAPADHDPTTNGHHGGNGQEALVDAPTPSNGHHANGDGERPVDGVLGSEPASANGHQGDNGQHPVTDESADGSIAANHHGSGNGDHPMDEDADHDPTAIDLDDTSGHGDDDLTTIDLDLDDTNGHGDDDPTTIDLTLEDPDGSDHPPGMDRPLPGFDPPSGGHRHGGTDSDSSHGDATTTGPGGLVVATATALLDAPDQEPELAVAATRTIIEGEVPLFDADAHVVLLDDLAPVALDADPITEDAELADDGGVFVVTPDEDAASADHTTLDNDLDNEEPPGQLADDDAHPSAEHHEDALPTAAVGATVFPVSFGGASMPDDSLAGDTIPFSGVGPARGVPDKIGWFGRLRVAGELFWFRVRRRIGGAMALVGLGAIVALVVLVAAREIRSFGATESQGVNVARTTVPGTPRPASTDVPFVLDPPQTHRTTTTTAPPRRPVTTAAPTDAQTPPADPTEAQDGDGAGTGDADGADDGVGDEVLPGDPPADPPTDDGDPNTPDLTLVPTTTIPPTTLFPRPTLDIPFPTFGPPWTTTTIAPPDPDPDPDPEPPTTRRPRRTTTTVTPPTDPPGPPTTDVDPDPTTEPPVDPPPTTEPGPTTTEPGDPTTTEPATTEPDPEPDDGDPPNITRPRVVALDRTSATVVYGADQCVATRYRLTGSDGSLQTGASPGYDPDISCSTAWSLDFIGATALAPDTTYSLRVWVKGKHSDQTDDARISFTTPE